MTKRKPKPPLKPTKGPRMYPLAAVDYGQMELRVILAGKRAEVFGFVTEKAARICMREAVHTGAESAVLERRKGKSWMQIGRVKA